MALIPTLTRDEITKKVYETGVLNKQLITINDSAWEKLEIMYMQSCTYNFLARWADFSIAFCCDVTLKKKNNWVLKYGIVLIIF